TAGLLASIDVPHRIFCWGPDAGANPYFAFLALADSIVVTCDSASMLAEACATRKPVYMFDLARDDSAADAPPQRTRGQRLAAQLGSPPGAPLPSGPAPTRPARTRARHRGRAREPPGLRPRRVARAALPEQAAPATDRRSSAHARVRAGLAQGVESGGAPRGL